MPAEKLAVIALHEATAKVLVRPTGSPFASAALAVGEAVEAEHNVMWVKENDIKEVTSSCALCEISRKIYLHVWHNVTS